MELPKMLLQALCIIAIVCLASLAFAGVLTWEIVEPIIVSLLAYLGIAYGYRFGSRKALTKAQAEGEPAWLVEVPLAIIVIGIPFLIWYFFVHGW